MQTTSYLVLYDGVCGLCHRAVRFILQRDRATRFRFAALESEVACELLRRHGVAPDADTLVLIVDYGSENEQALLRSRAARTIALGLGGGWGLMGRLAWLVPPGLGDWIYDFVAARRYRWFGKLEGCPVPDADVRDRFLG